MDERTVSIDMDCVTVEPAPSKSPTRRPYRRAQSAFLPGVEPGPLRSRPTSFPDGMSLEESSRPVFRVYPEEPRTPTGNEHQSHAQRSQHMSGYRTASSQLLTSQSARHLIQAGGLPRHSRPNISRAQLFLSEPSIATRTCNCPCQCENIRNNVNILPNDDSSPLQAAMGEMTPEDLSWRRLHMSRAKLKATATTSELLAGFAMVAMVELQINEDTKVPEWLFVVFSVCTTVLVAVHIFALMISTYLLPNIDAVSKLHVRGVIAESPHERMRGFIELAWAFSTVLGLFLFLVEVAILCWVKFWDYSFTAAWAATIIVVPVLVVFVAFAVHFYHALVVYKVKTASTDMKELEELRLKLEMVGTSHV